jgi:hypothetical protein
MTPSPKLRVRPVRVGRLTSDQIDRMWKLYADHYDHVTRDAFDRDLGEKTLVFLGIDAASKEIVGFSTARIYRHHYGGRWVGVYFSGDTVVLPQYWGQRALHNCVFATLVRWKLRHPFTPLYWHLICSGYRTYLTLVRNFPEHWPHHARATPRWERGLIDSICRERYGGAWRAERGVISFGEVQPVLKQAVAPFTSRVLSLPEVRFFVEANPGHAKGDELAMIARVNLQAGIQVLGKWLRRLLRRAAPARLQRRGADLPEPAR